MVEIIKNNEMKGNLNRHERRKLGALLTQKNKWGKKFKKNAELEQLIEKRDYKNQKFNKII